jgi:uncharacterized repeat protein (TIGR03943 family)
MRLWATKFLNGITLLGLGGVLISFCLKGRIDQYLHPQFRPWVLIGGIAFCIAGTVYLMAKKSMDCCVDGECVHTNRQSPWRAATAFGVIVLPLATGTYLSKDGYDKQVVLNRGFVQDVSKLPTRNPIGSTTLPQTIPPGALGADQDERASAEPPLPQDQGSSGAPPKDLARANDPAQTGGNPDDGSEQYLPRAADGNVMLEVTDLLYGESEESLRKEFAGKTIEVVGQFLPGAKPNEFKIVRMLIVCCAADARPIAVPVQVEDPVSIADMSWVKVIGTAEFVENGGPKAKVTFKAVKIEPTDPPQDAMLY